MTCSAWSAGTSTSEALDDRGGGRERYDLRVRTALLVAAAALVLAGLWWLARPDGRGPRSFGQAVVDPDPAGTSEPWPPQAFPPERPRDSETDEPESIPGSTRARVATTRAPGRAPIRGRLVLSGTEIPIEAELDVRLRTADLRLSESVTTLHDGTFASSRPFPRGVVLARVKDERGIELVDHEAPFEPLADGEWLVPIPQRKWPTHVTGRVLDRAERPLRGVVVQLIPQETGARYAEGWTGEEGRFRIEAPNPGVHRLVVQGPWSPRESQEIRVRAGLNDVSDVVLDEPPGAGELLVRLIYPSNAAYVLASFVLCSENRHEMRFSNWDGDEVFTEVEDGIQGICTLQVADLPPGSFRFEVRPLDGHSYEPMEAHFSPPATVEVHALGEPYPWTTIRVLDATTGHPIPEASVLGFTAGYWQRQKAWSSSDGDELPTRLGPGTERWVAMAPGHRARMGSLPNSSADEDLDVALEAGWSMFLRFVDVEGPAWFGLDPRTRGLAPLSGVQVFADRRPVGESDDSGFLLLDLDHTPNALEYRLAGWSVVSEIVGPPHVVRMARAP
jgi:hypothetical protein